MMRPSNVAMSSECLVQVAPAPSMTKASLLANPVDSKLCRWTVPRKYGRSDGRLPLHSRSLPSGNLATAVLNPSEHATV